MSGIVVAALAVSTASAGTNLFRNADYSQDDGLGGPVGWSLYYDGVQTVRAKSFGDGSWELIAVDPQNGYFRQTPVTLKPGAPYRLSADVMSDDLPDGAGFALQIQNHWWARNVSVPVPKSTGGKWRTISWQGAMIDSRETNDYSIGFLARGGTGGKPASIRIRNLVLEPLDAAGAAASAPISEKLMVALPQRIVPVSPLLRRVPKDKAAFRIYWPGGGLFGGVTNYTLIGRIGQSRLKARFDAEGYATLDFGQIAAGAGKLELGVADASGAAVRKDVYSIVAVKDLPTGPKGRKLNNFVTEIYAGPLKDGELRFFREGDGFVWISFTDAAGGCEKTARGYLDNLDVAYVSYDPDERYTETSRFVKAGWHRLTVKGASPGSRLRIHAVKRVTLSPWGVLVPYGGPCPISEREHHFTTAFMRRYRLPASNTLTAGPQHLEDPTTPFMSFFLNRGFYLMGGAAFHFMSRNLDEAYCRRQLKEGMWRRGWNISVDEILIGGPRSGHALISETLWSMYNERPKQTVDLFYADGMRNVFSDPKIHIAELAAVCNLGDGTGIIYPELYVEAAKEISRIDDFVDFTARLVRSAETMVPAMKGRVDMHMSPYTGLGHWTSATFPEVDLKQHYGYLAWRYATDPRFAGVAGLGGGPTAYCEEELIRWTGRIFRYYGVEGGTEDLAAKFGFRRLPGFVKNPDFDDGLAAWTVESGEVRPYYNRRLANDFEKRNMARGRQVGCHAAEFVTRDGVTARLSQDLKGLEPGAYYTVMFAQLNADNVDKPAEAKPPRFFSARLEGAHEVEGLRFCNRISLVPKSLPYVNTFRYVFRAESAAARLVFQDRDDAGRAAPDGTRQIVNYVVVRPFYHEDEADVARIADALQGR